MNAPTIEEAVDRLRGFGYPPLAQISDDHAARIRRSQEGEPSTTTVAEAVHVYRLARESMGFDRPMYRVVGTLCGAAPTGNEISATKAHEGVENLCPECRERLR